MGTGFKVCAVNGSPVSGSIIVSMLPWSAVTTIAMSHFCAAAHSRPMHSSTLATALSAAGSTPVWPTMSGLA